MKKISTIFLSLSCVLTFAQTSLSNAVDFTVTDVHGNTHNLFNILNGGQHVLLDFFFTTCSSCIATTPDYRQAYEDYGCNSGDIYFLSIDNGDNDVDVLDFEWQIMGSNPAPPAISGNEGGGNGVVSSYGILAYPTFVLIAPNKQIVLDDIWPFSYSILENQLTANGINKALCVTSVSENNQITFSVFPNPATDYIIVNGIGEIIIYNLLGKEVLKTKLESAKTINTSNFKRGSYFIELITSNNLTVREKILIK